MVTLPATFTERTRQLMGTERFERYLLSFEETPPVSIRLNPMKLTADWLVADGEPVPWCRDGYYLKQRPSFTMDPLLHAGCYYVQEAASMFLDEVVRQCSTFNVQRSTFNVQRSTFNVLDLCAAPGGKSTLLRTALPADCVLYSNEPVGTRASILLENVSKWGYQNHIVTNAFPKDYRRSKLRFDMILCDVPCSGEGMFRKDPATILEWSPQHVEKCRQLQRGIVSDAWACLNEGGILIYSTCTFNTLENEENIRWMLSEFDDAEVVPIQTQPEWHITGSLLDGFTEPVYRFIPGITRGEGLFMCVVRKRGERSDFREERIEVRGKRDDRQRKNKDLEGLTILSPLTSLPAPLTTDLTYQQAIAYLRGEAILLPADTPRGLVDVTFMGHKLGQVKNIGARANNLYPKPWRIKTTHVPAIYAPIIKYDCKL